MSVTPQGIRRVLARLRIVVLVDAQTCVVLIYVWGICEAQDPRVLCPDRGKCEAMVQQSSRNMKRIRASSTKMTPEA